MPSMGSEYATGEGSSYARAGKMPDGMNGGLGKAPGRQGMAKALVDGIRDYIGGAAETLGVRKGERTRHSF